MGWWTFFLQCNITLIPSWRNKFWKVRTKTLESPMYRSKCSPECTSRSFICGVHEQPEQPLAGPLPCAVCTKAAWLSHWFPPARPRLWCYPGCFPWPALHAENSLSNVQEIFWKRRPSKGQSWRRKTTYQNYYFHQTEFSSSRITSHQYAGIPIYLCLAAATKTNKVQVWRNLAEDMKCIGSFLIVADAHEVPGTSFRTVTTFYHLSSHTRNILLLCSHERNKQPSLICLTPPTPTPSLNPKCITIKYLPGKTTLAFSSCFNLPFSISIR